MRNFKKVLALVLALSMILSTSMISFAAEMTAAQKAETIGILKGEGAGVTAEYLAKTPTRLQAAIVSLRLRGLEDEATAYEGTEVFADQDDIMWAGGKAIASYLKANPELGWIGTDGKLMPNEPITAQAYVKVMLESLGFVQGTDFEWADVFTFAATKGLTGLDAATTMTNDDLAVGSVEALAATTADDKVLVEVLVEAGAIVEADAVAAGLVAETPDELAVVSVEAINLVQVEVVFNMEVDSDSAETISNYDVDDQDIVFAELQEDGKTVILNLKTAAASDIVDQQDEYDVTVEDVEDLNENELAEILFENVVFFDNEAPTVVEAEIVGVNTVKVTFSEPVQGEDFTNTLKSTFTVVDEDGDKVYVKSDGASGTRYVNDSKTEVYVVLSSDLDTKDSITISVDTDMEDFAGFGVMTNSTTLVVAVDDTKPEVIGYKDTSANEVTLIFDGDIELVGTLDLDDFYHTNSKNPAKTVVVENGDELVLTFDDDYELPEGSAYIYINDEALADLWENENDDIRVKIEVEIDDEKPVVEKIELDDQDTIIITFSEDVDDVDRSDFTVYDEDDDKVSIASVSVTDDEVTVNFRDDLSGEYTITIEDLEDIAGNEISATTLTFNADDETQPVLTIAEGVTVTLYDAGTEDQMIKVFYNEKMDVSGTYSVALEANYAISDNTIIIDLSDMDDIDIDVVDDGEGVEIAIPYDASDDDNDNPSLDFNNDELIIARVADAAGNYTVALSTPRALVNGSAAIVEIDSAEMTAADTIEVTLTAKLSEYVDDDLVISITGTNLVVGETGTSSITNTDISGIDLEEDDDGNTVVVITLEDDIVSGGWSTATVKTSDYTTGDDRSETVYGIELEDNSLTKLIDDSIAPAVAVDSDDDAEVYVYDADAYTFDVNGDIASTTLGSADGQLDTIVIEYQESIDQAFMNEHIYEVGDIDILSINVSAAISSAAASIDTTNDPGRFVVIKLDVTDDDLYLNDTETSLVVEQVASIFDSAGNELVIAEADTLETKDAAAPVAVTNFSAPMGSTENPIELTWDNQSGDAGLDHFELYYKVGGVASDDVSVGNSTLVSKTISATATSYTTTLNGIDKYFAIYAVDGDGNKSPVANINTVPPVAVTSFAAADSTGDTEIDLSWIVSADADHYELYYRVGNAASDNNTLISDNIAGNVDVYTFNASALTNGDDVHFAIYTVDSNDNKTIANANVTYDTSN